MVETSKTANAPELHAGEQAAAVRDDRLEWQTPSLIVASGKVTGHSSSGGSDGGVFPAPDSNS